MCNLSKQEKEALDMLLTTQPSVVCSRLNIQPGHLNQIKTRVRRKEAKAKKFLTEMRDYKHVLHRRKPYKGI